MYQCINSNIKTVLAEIPGNHVSEYEWLSNSLREKHVDKDREFQRRYRSYWVMRYIAPNSQFNILYFSSLEKYKNKKPDFRTVMEEMNSIPYDSSGKKTAFQFSFISKLLHSLDNSSPIYDSMVNDFFYLPSIVGNDLETKISKSENVLNFLNIEMERIKSYGLLDTAIERFNKQFRPTLFSKNKIIDSLIWAFIKSARKGGFLAGPFLHS